MISDPQGETIWPCQTPLSSLTSMLSPWTPLLNRCFSNHSRYLRHLRCQVAQAPISNGNAFFGILLIWTAWKNHPCATRSQNLADIDPMLPASGRYRLSSGSLSNFNWLMYLNIGVKLFSRGTCLILFKIMNNSSSIYATAKCYYREAEKIWINHQLWNSIPLCLSYILFLGFGPNSILYFVLHYSIGQ